MFEVGSLAVVNCCICVPLSCSIYIYHDLQRYARGWVSECSEGARARVIQIHFSLPKGHPNSLAKLPLPHIGYKNSFVSTRDPHIRTIATSTMRRSVANRAAGNRLSKDKPNRLVIS